MTVKNYIGSGMTLKGFLAYQEPELIAVTGDDKFALYHGERLVRLMPKDELLRFINSLPHKKYAVEGVPWEVSLPDTVRAALAHNGLMKTAKDVQDFLRGSLRPVMKEIMRGAYTQTTENGHRKFVKATPWAVVAPTHNTRGLDPEAGYAIFMLTKAVSFDNRPVALDHRVHSFAQTPAQAVWNHDIGRRLADRGILLVPNGKSVAAIGFKAKSAGTARLQAAGAGKSGPKAKKSAAKTTRPEKKVGEWTSMVEGFATKVNRVAVDAAKNLTTKFTLTVRKHLAVRAVKAAFKLHLRLGNARVSESTVRATAHALATPHAGVKLVDKAFAKVAADLDKVGFRVVKNYQTNNRMLAPTAHVALEQQLGRRIDFGMAKQTAGGTHKAVAEALATKKLTAAQYQAAAALAGPGRVVFADPRRPAAVGHAAQVFRHHGKDVWVVGGDKAMAKQLGSPNFSMSGFLDSATRTSHLRSLWIAIRTQCWMSGNVLKTAEMIRACKPRVQLKKNSMIVVCPKGIEDARAVAQILKLAAKRDSKVVFSGPHAKVYRAMAESQTVKQTRMKGMRL